VAAALHQFGERVAHLLQLADAGFDQPDLGLGGGAGALTVGVGVERQQAVDFLERETELLGAADRPQAGEFGRAVGTVGAARGGRLGEQAAALIVADGLDADPGGPGQGADGERRCDILVHGC